MLIVAVVGSLTGARETVAAAPPTKAQALAFARAVNLVAADVPGFKGSRSTSSSGRGAAIKECAGRLRPAQRLVSADSPDFTGRSASEVSSTVTVLASSRRATRDIAVFSTARGRSCIRRAVALKFHARKRSHVNYGRPAISFLSQPAAGSDGSFKVRIKITLSERGFSARVQVDLLGFRVGSSLVTLTVGGAGPFPVAEEERLFSLLLARATANRL